MNITNEEIKSHLNYPKPSDVTSMNIKSEEIDSQFHWRQFHNFRVRFVCIRLGVGGGGGLDWESQDFDCELMISYFTIKRADKKNSTPETLSSDFVISLLSRFLDNPRKDTVCKTVFANSALQWSFAVLFPLIMHARARPLGSSCKKSFSNPFPDFHTQNKNQM